MERSIIRLVSLIPLVLASGAAHAIDYYLRADVVPPPVTMPDGAVVPMWGFALENDTFTAGTPAQVPGPRLTVPPGDTTLTIHLRNSLPMLNGAQVPVSIVIPGLPSASSPVYDGARVRSFAPETLPGADGIYTWTVAPGTYLYQSGTHPQVQLQMGLYGAVTMDAAANEAYPGVGYSTEVLLLFSEIDPALHQAVATDNYGPGKSMTSTVNYAPKYFLVNGAPYSAASLPVPAGFVNDRVLVRMLNAGLETHAPLTQGQYLRVLAEDGKPLPYTRDQYALFLPAGKTLDSLLLPNASGDYPLYDRRLRLTNAATTGGGMLAFLIVENRPGAPTALADAFTLNEDTPLNIAPPGVLANDTDPESDPLTAVIVSQPAHGTLALNADGSFGYTPAANYNGKDFFTYQASDGTNLSGNALVTLTINPVNDAPTAMDDAANTAFDQAVTINVLANDLDIDGDTLSIGSVSASVAGGTIIVNPDQTLTYTPPLGFGGTDTFTYTASDGVLQSAPATVTISVTANAPPLAVADTAVVAEDTAVVIAVLANDSDPNGSPIALAGMPRAAATTKAAIALAAVTQPAHGTVTQNPDGTVTYQPALNFNGIDTFTYSVTDGQAISIGTVTVTVTPVNDAPVAVPDTIAVNTQSTFTLPAAGVLTNDTDVDGDTLTAALVTNTAQGTVSLSANGGLAFSPPNQWVGTTSFTYQASDGVLTSGAATVSLTRELFAKEVRFTAEDNKPADWVIKGLSSVPGSSLTFYVGATPGGTVIGTTTVANDGRFIFRDRGATAVPDASQRISIQSSTGATLVNVPVVIQTNNALAAPLAARLGVADSITMDQMQYEVNGNLVLSGSASPGASLTVSLDGVAIGSATAGADGRWTFSTTGTTAAAGSTVRVDSAAGSNVQKQLSAAGVVQ